MSVSEACGELKIQVVNKEKHACSVGVRTVDDTASHPKDYEAIDKVIKFEEGTEHEEIFISIVNDDSFEPDEDFLVELYDAETKQKLQGRDCQVRITILDDDQPGTLVFENPKMRQAVNVNMC